MPAKHPFLEVEKQNGINNLKSQHATTVKNISLVSKKDLCESNQDLIKMAPMKRTKDIHHFLLHVVQKLF